MFTSTSSIGFGASDRERREIQNTYFSPDALPRNPYDRAGLEAGAKQRFALNNYLLYAPNPSVYDIESQVGRAVQTRWQRLAGRVPMSRTLVGPMNSYPVSPARFAMLTKASNQMAMDSGYTPYAQLMMMATSDAPVERRVRTSRPVGPRTGIDVASRNLDEVTAFIGQFRSMLTLLPPGDPDRAAFESILTRFEGIVGLARQLDEAAMRGDLKGGQEVAKRMSAELIAIFGELPPGVRKLLMAHLGGAGLLTGTERGPGLEIHWDLRNIESPIIELRVVGDRFGVSRRRGRGRGRTSTERFPTRRGSRRGGRSETPVSTRTPSTTITSPTTTPTTTPETTVKTDEVAKKRTEEIRKSIASAEKRTADADAMEKDNKTLVVELTTLTENMTKAEKQAEELSHNIITMQKEGEDALRSIDELERKLATNRTEIGAQIEKYRKQAEEEIDAGRPEAAKKTLAFAAELAEILKESAARTLKTVEEIRARRLKMDESLTKTQEQVKTLRELRTKISGQITDVRTRIADREKTIAEFRKTAADLLRYARETR
jgi:predicted  nucleic acid-binding Zn-ribbon protein